MNRARRILLRALALAIPFACGIWAASVRQSQPVTVMLLESIQPRDKSESVSPGDVLGREEGFVLDERQHDALTSALAQERGIWTPRLRRRLLDGAMLLELGDSASGSYTIRIDENREPEGGGRQWFVGVSHVRQLGAFEKAARWCKRALGI